MLKFNGKRTERLDIPSQIRVDPVMANMIRMRASVNRRPVGSEIVCLLEIALQSFEVGSSQVQSVGPVSAHDVEWLKPPGPVSASQVESGVVRRRA